MPPNNSPSDNLMTSFATIPYFQELAELASPVPNYAATLRTQEEDANDANVSFLRSQPEILSDTSPRATNSTPLIPARAPVVSSPDRQDLGRIRRGLGSREIRHRYTPAQLQELGTLREAAYHGWRPGSRERVPESSSDDEDDWDLPVSSSPIPLPSSRSDHSGHRLPRIDLPSLFPTSPSLSESSTRATSLPENLETNEYLGQSEPSLRTNNLLQSLRQRSQLSSRSSIRLPHNPVERETLGRNSDAPGQPTSATLVRPYPPSSASSPRWDTQPDGPSRAPPTSLYDQLQHQRRQQYAHHQAFLQAQQQQLQQQLQQQQQQQIQQRQFQLQAQQQLAQRHAQRQGQLQALQQAQFAAQAQNQARQQALQAQRQAHQSQPNRRQAAYVVPDSLQTQQAIQRSQMIALHREWVDQGRHQQASRVETYRQRYLEHPSANPPSSARSLDDTIKYLGRLCFCESEYDGFLSAKAGGFQKEDYMANNDFILDTSIIEPPPQSSWLMIGAVFSGSQHAASSSASTGYRGYHNSVYQHISTEARSNWNGILPIGGADGGRVARANQSPQSSVGDTAHRRMESDERWPVKVTIHSIDYDSMTLSGTMEAFNVPDKTSPTRESSISTFLEGEILDFNRYTLETKSYRANANVDGTYWRQLSPFKNLPEEEIVKVLVSKKWLTEELSKKWILMRWKEKCFVTPTDSQSSLTISGFYYVSLRREDGQVEGLYYDPSSTPYQHLSLMPEKRYFPAYEFQ